MYFVEKYFDDVNFESWMLLQRVMGILFCMLSLYCAAVAVDAVVVAVGAVGKYRNLILSSFHASE
jgi:hypothetical protein